MRTVDRSTDGRAFQLLREWWRLRVQGDVNEAPTEDCRALVKATRELLAEEVPGTEPSTAEVRT